VDPLTALPLLAEYFNKPAFSNAAVVSPDVGRAKLAGLYAEMLNLPLVVMHKRREGLSKVDVSHVVGDIEGKIPILIDDVIAGGSILQELEALFAAGAREEAHLAITHGVLLDSALQRLEDPRIAKLVVTDTICQPPAVLSHPKITIVSIAHLLAAVIGRIHAGQSISSLMNKAKV